MSAPVAMEGASWKLFPHIIFYRTGFPYEWLERLRFQRTIGALRRLDEAAADLEHLSAEVARALAGSVARAAANGKAPERLRLLSAARRAVVRSRPVGAAIGSGLDDDAAATTALSGWNRRNDDLDRLDREARAAFAAELPERRAALRDIAADPVFQEAVFASNPNLPPATFASYLAEWRAEGPTARARRFERRLASYVQRATMKTDVASLFGPINVGQLDEREPRPVVLAHPPDRKHSAREVFFSFWAVEAIARHIGSDEAVRPYLRPRLHPACELVAERRTLDHLRLHEHDLDPLEAAVLPLADGETTVLGIAERLSRPIDETLAAFKRLAARGCAILELEVPSTIFHPFTAVLDFVRGLPASCARRPDLLASLEALDEARRGYRDAPLAGRVERLAEIERRFTALAGGVAPRRRPGETYADRTTIYEDCRGTVETLVFGAPFIERLRRELGPALEIVASYGWLCHAHYRRIAREAFDAVAPDARDVAGGTPAVPFSLFVAKLQEMGRAGRFAARSQEMEAFELAWTRKVVLRAEEGGGRVARLSADDVRDLVRLAPPPGRNLHAAPDLLISARDEDALRRGEYKVVVGEVGENVYIWGSQFFFYERRAEAEREVAELFRSLPEYRPFALLLARRPHKGLTGESFAGTFIDVEAKTMRPPGASVPFRDLRVFDDREGELAVGAADGRTFQFFHHHDERVHLWAFAPPRILVPPLALAGPHVPRIEVSGIVLLREQWRVPASAFAEAGRAGAAPFERFRGAWLAKERLSLPDRAFVHVRSEMKPYGIDFASTFSVDLLLSLAAREEELRFVEMLPTEDDLWFREADGRYCTELRFLAYRS